MAYYEKTGKGWRVHIATKGVRQSRTFVTKGAAQAWAVREESALIDGTAGRWPRKTLEQAITRYEKEITPSKGSRVFEGVAFGVIRREVPELCAQLMHTITAQDLAAWILTRGKSCSGSTVVRYASVLRNVWTVAAKRWEWTPEPTPWGRVKLPAEAPPRERLIGWREARAILRRLNYSTGMPPITKMQQCAYAFLLGLRTAMRASEILSLSGESVDLARRVATLAHHKTIHHTHRAREVPLTRQGVRLLSVLHRPGPLFDVGSRSLDALFRKARKQTGLSGFTFHDSRATAVTNLARTVPVEVLARITGHRNVSLLVSVYYRTTAADIASRL